MEMLPPGYATGSNYPLIIHLHGIGERIGGANGTTTVPLEAVAKFGPGAFVKSGGKLPADAVILSPQAPKMSLWDAKQLDGFLVFALSKYKVDPKRVYLMGLSLGGFGVNSYLQVPEYASKVAAAIAICPGQYLLWSGAVNVTANKTPYLGVHAQDDQTVVITNYSDKSFTNLSQVLGGGPALNRPVLPHNPEWDPAHGLRKYSTETGVWDPALKKFVFSPGFGIKATGPQYFYTVYSDGGHVVWDRIYTDPAVYSWVFGKSK